ncbi:MAG TPA: aminoacyl-tRNA deacylase [Deltaproteobacteria bacterium]|nr:aminoacyl-tRNA deacylase [Deltaproteobacteria bacterium]
MSRKEYPITQAVRFFRKRNIRFIPRLYPYVDHGGTRQAATSLDVPEHQVIKTLLMETDEKNPIIILMHGDCEVSLKQLARRLKVKRITPCDEKSAEHYTGYKVGGISPFGTHTRLPVYAQETIMDFEKIYINAGSRGFMVEISTSDLADSLGVTTVDAAVKS